MNKNIETKIVGSWEAISCIYKDENGKKVNYYGNGYKGILIYDSYGNVAAQLTRGERILFSGAPLAFTGSPKECKAAFDSYQAYFGKYKFDYKKKAVIHSVKGSLRPNWVGHKEVRFPKIKGDILTLKTPPLLVENGEIVFTLKWKKIK